jgi:2-polyprenyl-3-methyl-5-hydroxy-6-metoxy-1,4-benzoquinol methylase
MDLPQFSVHAATEESHWWFQGRLMIVRALLARYIRPHDGRTLVDVGCGTGGVSAALSGEYQMKGIDPIPEAIALAQQRFPGIPFRIGRAPDDVQDWFSIASGVLLLDVLEHVEEDFNFISTLLAAMRPGTLLLITAPADPLLWGEHDRGFGHCRRYTIARFRELWKGLPVREHLVSPINAHLYWVVRFGRWLTRLLHRSLGPGSTDLSTPITPVNAILKDVFGSERHRLLHVVEHRARPFSRGVSMLALLERGSGIIVPRKRPEHIPADQRPWLDQQR